MIKNIFFIFVIIWFAILFPLSTSVASDISARLAGKLLLQVEDRGRIWYVDFNNKRHEVTFSNALSLFETLALGISNKDLNSIPKNGEIRSSATGNRLRGKLLLQVEDKGRIWYVDFNGKRWEVTWANLMDLFKSLALGITDKDLGEIASYSQNISSPTAQPSEQTSINNLLEAVVQVNCYTGYSSSQGSGFLYKINSGYKPLFSPPVIYVATNYHVVNDANIKGCYVIVYSQDNSYTVGMYKLDIDNIIFFNSYADAAFLKITDNFSPAIKSEGLSNLNNNVAELNKCSSLVATGSKVYIVGYPSYAESSTEIGGYSSTINARTITEGIISGYDNSSKYPYGVLPYSNYYVSADVDAGNSGGLALAEEGGQLCLLGMPTWVSIGTYTNRGIVQNINNILYEKK